MNKKEGSRKNGEETQKKGGVKVQGIQSIEVVEVIKTRTIVGKGTKEDPTREVVQYWDKAGKLIAQEKSEQNANLSSTKEKQDKLEKLLMDFIEKASKEPLEVDLLPQVATVLANLIKAN